MVEDMHCTAIINGLESGEELGKVREFENVHGKHH